MQEVARGVGGDLADILIEDCDIIFPFSQLFKSEVLEEKMSKGGLFYFSKIITYLVLWLPVFTVGEMGMTESKVDPFSLILNGQRKILDNMNLMMKRLTELGTLEAKVNALATVVLTSNEDLVRRFEVDLSQLSSKVELVGKEVAEIKSNQDAASEEWISFARSVKDELRETSYSCNITSSSLPITSSPYTPTSKATRSINDTQATPLIYNEEEEAKDDAAELTGYDSAGDAVLSSSSLALFLRQNLNFTSEQLTRVLNQLRNLEYRQHISNLSQDRRLNTLLHKIVIHEDVLESRLKGALQLELKMAVGELKDEMGSLGRRLLDSETFLDVDSESYSTAAIKNDSTAVFAVECLQGDSSCLSGSEEVTESAIHTPVPSTFPPPTTSLHGLLEDSFEDTDSPDTTETSEEAALTSTYPTFSNSSDQLVASLHEDDVQDVTLRYDVPHVDPREEEVPTLSPVETSEEDQNSLKKNIENQSTESEVLKQTLKYVAKLLKSQMHEVEVLISRRLNSAEEKLTGIRIHQTSSFYSQSKEMRYEMGKLERGISEAIRTTGSKISKKLEARSKALFSFIDAAVTSISSAAVTSAQSTGLQVAKQLRQSMQDIGVRISEFNQKTTNQRCPEMYQLIGTTCLLALANMSTTWSEGCKFCQVVGGRYVSLQQAKNDDARVIKALRHFGFDEIWLRDDDEDTGCESRLEVDYTAELSNSVHLSSGFSNLVYLGGCPALVSGEELSTEAAPCSKKLSVVCQYQIVISQTSGNLATKSDLESLDNT